MSKLEIVRNLNDSGPQLQIVRSVAELQQIVQQMHEDMTRLPDGIAQALQALEPLSKLEAHVSAALSLQRQALDAALGDMTARMESLTATMARSAKMASQAASQMAAIPDKITQASEGLIEASARVVEMAERTRPRPWRQALGIVAAGVIGGLVVTIGHVALSRPAPPAAAQQEIEQMRAAAQWLDQIWVRATPQERQLLQEIAKRPAP